MLGDFSGVSGFGGVRVVISGKDRLLVEEHRGILAYSDTKLLLRLADGKLSVSGETLEISEYGERDIVVTGRIKQLEFL